MYWVLKLILYILMDKKKIVLTIIGIAALVVPVILLIVFTSDAVEQQPEVSTGERKINPQTVEEAAKKIPSPSPIILPSPTPATTSAEVEAEGSPSAQ